MISDEMVARILDMIENIGSIAVNEGFELAVRYQFANGIAYLIFAIGILVAGVLSIRWGVRKMDEDEMNPAGFIVILFSAMGLVSFPFLLYGGIMRIIVPEWYAIQSLFALVTGG